MALFKFKNNDIFYNRIKTYPQVNFFIYDRQIYYNKIPHLSGSFTSTLNHVPGGSISLYEENVDRPAGQLIYPFITKDSSLTTFKTVSTSEFNEDFNYGDKITGSYPLSANISIDRFAPGQSRLHIDALRNTLNYYTTLSNHYNFISSLGDKSTQELGLISIPSIFYGSSIKKGSVECNFYVSGSLIGKLQDVKRNGELIQTLPTASNNSGSCAGVVLYNEGFLVLTGSWDISNGTHTEPYTPGAAAHAPRWIDFASTGSSGVLENLVSSSFELNFSGLNYIPTITMLCHLHKGDCNYSNNPTFMDYGQSALPSTGSIKYAEREDLTIKNIVKSPYTNYSGSFEKTTYISTIGIYDDNKNLIAVAKLARPLRKRETDEATIKIKIDF